MIFSDKMYNGLKKLVQVLLPAASVLYLALAGLWNLPYGQQVAGTLAALAGFLGVILGISSKQYEDLKMLRTVVGSMGQMIVTEKEDGKVTASLELEAAPEDIIEMDSVTFQVIKAPKPRPTGRSKKKPDA